jgi:HEAT repeat protein
MRKQRPTSKSARSEQRPRSAAAALSVATNPKRSSEERVAAMAEAPLAVCGKQDNLQKILAVLRDNAEPVEVRLAALQALQAASFSVIAFEDCRAPYTAALREIASDDVPEIRLRALEDLALQKDRFAQEKLLEGLRDGTKALVPPEKALQLLGYDVHAEYYPLAREIVDNPPSPSARREALRLLGADPAAAPLFERVLGDKAEAPEVRRIAAAVLQTTRPEKLQQQARDILLDSSEPQEMQALSLTALVQYGDEAALAGDEALRSRVDQLQSEPSEPVSHRARQFLTKYGG